MIGDMDHTDFIGEDQKVLCYGFDPEADEPVPELLLALKAIGESHDRKVRDRAFTVWGGSYGPYYWIAVPAPMAAGVTKLLSEHLEKAAGYDTLDRGRTARMGLVPAYRYDHGAVAEYVGEYTGEGQEGTSYVDDPGSGLTLHRRTYMPAGLMGGERYGRVDPGKSPGGEP